MGAEKPVQLADNAPHLLVVDDDRRIRDLLSRFLLSEGYRVTTAQSAAEARAKLEGLRFDLMILDVMMPGENGFEFARSLRTLSTVPILMLTARDEAESRIAGLEIGADDYVGKPFELRVSRKRSASFQRGDVREFLRSFLDSQPGAVARPGDDLRVDGDCFSSSHAALRAKEAGKSCCG